MSSPAAYPTELVRRTSEQRQDARLMLFDLYDGGHHGQHIRVLTEYWTRHGLPGSLDVVVSQEFCDRFPGLVAARGAGSKLRFHATDEPVRLNAKEGRMAVLRNDLRIGRHLRKALLRHRPDRCMLMYFDHVQASLATDLRFRFPLRISGTYFRPSFYYGEHGAGPAGARTAVEDFQKRALLRMALRNPHFDTLFSLDPYAVDPIRGLGTKASVVHLPEPFESDPPLSDPPNETRRRLGIEAGREVLLLFGSLDPRKGALELLEALLELPESLARRASLVMAGETTSIRPELARAIGDLRARGALQVVHIDAFVPDAEMHNLFAAASLVVMPYQRHVGSSGVLVRAATAGVPVLGPEYGMLGALIEDRGLGLRVDATRPAEIARGLARFLDPAGEFPFDPAQARSYAAENTEEAMAQTVFRHVLGETTSAYNPQD